jgi:hypothetical protein
VRSREPSNSVVHLPAITCVDAGIPRAGRAFGDKATAGSVLLATAGCTTNSDANDGNPDDTPGNNTPDGDTPDGDTPDGDAPDGNTPGNDAPDRDPDEGDAVGAVGAVFEDCPSFADDVETTQITVHNETGGQVGLNPYAWQLHERNPGPSVSRSAV